MINADTNNCYHLSFPFVTKEGCRIHRYFWIALGSLSLILGTIGIVLPILPTVPFYMLTLFCFAKGSPRLHCWFKTTDLYRRHVADFVEKRGVSRRKKWKIIAVVTLLMAFAAWLMPPMTWAYILLAVVWTLHTLYILFAVKTA